MAHPDVSHAMYLAQHAHRANERHAKLDSKVKGAFKRIFTTAEVGAGALIGGVLEGKTADSTGGKLFHVPYSLGLGFAFLAFAHTPYAGGESNQNHLNNFGTGFLANYLSSVGHAFGQNWSQRGFRGALTHGAPMPMPLPAAPPVDPTTMAAMAASMKQAAGVAY